MFERTLSFFFFDQSQECVLKQNHMFNNKNTHNSYSHIKRILNAGHCERSAQPLCDVADDDGASPAPDRPYLQNASPPTQGYDEAGCNDLYLRHYRLRRPISGGLRHLHGHFLRGLRAIAVLMESVPSCSL